MLYESYHRKPKRGFVYVVKVGDGIYKIGHTKDLKSRMSNYQSHILEKVNLVYFVEVADMVRLEYEMHSTFNDQRIDSREMFRLSDVDIEMIRTYPDELARYGVDVRL